MMISQRRDLQGALICLFTWLTSLLCSPDPMSFRDFVLVADSQGPRLVQIPLEAETTPNVLVLKGLQNPVGVEYDPTTRKVYWTDAGLHQISSAKLDGTEQAAVLKLPPVCTPEGLALDVTAQLIFYTSNGRSYVGVVNFNGLNDIPLVENLKSPRAIEVDPVHRYIYWSDYVAEVIEMAQYDGRNRQVILTSPKSWINGIALDIPNNKLYWTDARSDLIGELNLADRTQSILFTAVDVQQQLLTTTSNTTIDTHFFDIDIGNGRLYITDWSDRNILEFSFIDRKLAMFSVPAFAMLSGIKFYQYNTYQLGVASSCNVKNGTCSNLCVPMPPLLSPDHVCLCPDDQPLLDDLHTCKTVSQQSGPDLLWLESDNIFTSFIRGIPGEPEDFLLQQELSSWIIRSPYWLWSAVDFSYDNNRLYLVDEYDRFVVQLSLNSSLKIDVIYRGTSTQVGGLAYDWRSNTLYWTDVIYNWIKVCSAQPEALAKCATLIEDNLDQPHGIAVHPIKGFLYWTDWGSQPKIEVSSLAGENRRVLITTNLNRPKGLTLDYKKDRLFWCNVDAVYMSNLDGTSITLIGSSTTSNFVGIAYFSDFVFTVDQAGAGRRSQIWFFNLINRRPVKMPLDKNPFDVLMYHHDRQPNPVDYNNVEIKLSCRDCQHLCITSPNRANSTQCLCADGFALNGDGRTCTQDYAYTQPFYVYALTDRICTIPYEQALGNINNLENLCHFKSDSHVFKALAFHSGEGYYYFSEAGTAVKSIRKAHITDTQNNSVVVFGVGDVQGLAVDYLSSNLYWSEITSGVTGHIWASRLDGTFQKRVVQNIAQVSSLALDLSEKILFWVDSRPSRIMKSGLDGSLPTVFIMAGVVHITGLTFDPYGKRLYWVDHAQSRIESIMYSGDGNTRRVEPVHYTSVHNMRDLDIYKDFLVLTDAGNNATASGLYLFSRHTGEAGGKGVVNPKATDIGDVIVYAKYNQPMSDFSSACSSNPCGQLCFDLPMKAFVCGCVDGMALDSTGICQPVRLTVSNFLLMADDFRHSIYSLADTDYSQMSSLKIPASDRPMAVAFDPVENKIYWSDFATGLLKRSNMDGSHVEEIMEYKSQKGRVDGLAFDYSSRVLYYTDTNRNLIGIINPTGTNHKVLLNISQEVYSPRAIVLDHSSGHIYYTTRQLEKGRIVRASQDGSARVDLITSNVSWPTGLDIDFTAGRIYWVDAHTEKIESSNLQGQDRKLVFQQNSSADAFGLAVVQGFVYWTDWNARGLFRVSTTSAVSSHEVIGTDFFGGLNDIKYYGSFSPDKGHPCADHNGGCSHFCLRTSFVGYVCACPDYNGNTVNTKDGKNCPTAEACTSLITNGNLEMSCSFRLGATCAFTCNPGYTPLDPTLTALNCVAGLVWDQPVYKLCKSTICDVLIVPTNAYIDGTCTSLPGSQCTARCLQGFKPQGGDGVRTCMNDLTWSGSGLVCTELPKCPSKTFYDMSLVSMDPRCVKEYQYAGDNCLVQCAPGYKTANSPSASITCNNDGTWSGTPPVCLSDARTTAGLTTQAGHIMPTDTTQGAVSEDKSGSSLTPIIVGVVVAVLVLGTVAALVILVVSRNVPFVAKYRSSPTFGRQRPDDTYPVIAQSRDVSPSYSAKLGKVQLDDSMAFENPGYASLANDGMDDANPYAVYETIQHDILTDIDKIEVTLDPKSSEFSNPMYGRLASGSPSTFQLTAHSADSTDA